jgi:hypothetical protein
MSFFGEKLKEYRLKYSKVGLSKFARQIGILPSDLSQMERGLLVPSSEQFVNSVIFKIFGNDNLEQRVKLYSLWRKDHEK